MLIKIKTVSGRLIEIEIENNETVLDLKNKIEEYEQISPPQQKLIFNGHILSDESEKLLKYNLQAGNVVHMVLALRGG